MFVRSQEDSKKAPLAAATTTTKTSESTVQVPLLLQQQQSGAAVAEEKQRYTTIAPRPTLVAQQPAKPPTAKKKANAAAKEQRRPAGTAKSAKPRAEKKAKQAASVVSASAAESSVGLVSAPQQAATDLSGPNAFAALDADDRLIQELLAGIPASAWLPTDPLTSEDWFLDPGSSVFTHDNIFPPATQQQQQQQPPPLPASSSSSHIPGAFSALLTSGQPTTSTIPPNSTSLDAAAAGSHQAPDMRVLAGVRQKRDTPLLSGRPAKGNPLSGFAKKHGVGVGYAVGNQVAILSPALLSSSPPSAKQLRQNPYKYYSPPKPVPRSQPKSAQSKGRNLMLGATSKSTAKHAASSPVKTTGAAAGNARMERPGAVKWEIAQNKALLSGVRQLRWGTRAGEHRTAEEARDPSRFVEDDWERIAREVSLTGAQRSARQCRRRWAWLHVHLGSSIMEYVDTSPTPQSSAQTTPVVPRETEGAPTHIRNLRLADLPRSSPPIHPVRLRESRVDSTPDVSVPNTPALDPLKERGAESRWDDPAYCQLLADVVQALSDPQSRAARVVRMFAPEIAATKAVSTPAPTPIPDSAVAPAPIFISAASSSTPAVPPPVGSHDLGTQQLMPHLMLAPPVAMSMPPFSDLPAIANLVTSSAMPLFTSDHHSARLSNTPLILPSATKSPAVTAVADDLASHGPMDQDLNVYMQFLQSLTNDQIDLGNAWSTLFEGAGGNAPGSSVAEPIAGLGPMTMSVCDVPMKPASDKLEKKSGSAGNMAASIEDDDMDDGDFVLDEEDDDDDEDEDDDDEVEDTEAVSRPGSSGLRPLGHVDTLGSRLHLSKAAAAAATGGGGSISDSAWNLALSELGLGSTSAATSMAPGLSLPFGQVSSELGENHGLFAPDPLLRQLMQGVADLGRSTTGVNGVSSGGSGGVSSDSVVGRQSVWLPNAASDSTMLPQWDATNGFSLATTAAPSQTCAKAAGKAADVSATAGAPKDAAQGSKGVSVSRTGSQQNKQQQSQAPGDLLLARRGLLKAPRKRHSAISVGSNSYKKAMLAAERAGPPPPPIDVDGLLGSEAGGMDTEMSGLYQDALQEGEELDVQEESLQADNSEFLFLGDQMAQLRAQQLMNFQLVVQAFLIACAELGPHAPRARHWRRQLDQLALWHSLGTRESPTDLVSGEGLARFSQLIESAERRGAGGMTESAGRFAPNPTSFFAIPGITAVIPDIYEAVDEIHRAAHVTGDSEGSGAAEVRSLNAAMEFTPRCNCTAVRGFKSAIVLECVFPRLHLQLRNGKRKAEPETESTVAGKRQASAAAATPPQSSSRAGDAADVAAGQLAQVPGAKALQSKPVASRPAPSGSGGQGGGHLPTLMPQAVSEILPSCTQADQRAIIDEIRTHMRTFKRDLHRVPRYRRRVYLQGDDGVPRLDWIPVKIQPLGFPAAMQCVMAPLLAHCGFQESMLPQIVMVRKPKNRIHFLESEDALLLLGLRMFGIEDLASVRVHLIPCKTASQLRNRMNNLRARRQAPNAIKDFCLRRIAPFTLEEEEILRVGVLVYGDEFRRVNTNQNLLINRPILALSHVWNHVRKKPDAVK